MLQRFPEHPSGKHKARVFKSRLGIVAENAEKLRELIQRAAESLPSGLVGTIVEVYEGAEDSQYLVEFADKEGREYAMATFKGEELLALHYELTEIGQESPRASVVG